MTSQGRYIGITDFTNAQQSWDMIKVLQKCKEGYIGFFGGRTWKNKNIKIGCGVMMSYKTLNNLVSKWENIFPPKNTIKRIFVSHPDVINILHYADYQNITAPIDLYRAVEYGGSNLNTIQFDMPWPNLELLISFRKENPDLRVILQIGRNALKEINNDPILLVEKLKKYQNLIDDVLLDESGGLGRPMDANGLESYLDAIDHEFGRSLGLVVAGGLGPDTMNLAQSIICRYNASVDAQSCLRISKNAMDPIEWDLAEKYIQAAYQIYPE